MSDPARVRTAQLAGHGMVTLPAAIITLLILTLNLHMFGQVAIWYYVTAAAAGAWQFAVIARRNWQRWISRRFAEEDASKLFSRSRLPGNPDSTAGALALHTAVAAMCALHVAPWLVGRVFEWILPLLQIHTTMWSADYYLQHLAIVTAIPALVLGYVISERGLRWGTWAWVLPTLLLAYKLVTFSDSNVSVLSDGISGRWSYFFVIERYAPRMWDTRGSDPERLLLQMTIVASFYAGLAYSAGGLLSWYKTKLKQRDDSHLIEDVASNGSLTPNTNPEPDVELPSDTKHS